MLANARLTAIQSNQTIDLKKSDIFVGYVFEVILDEDNETIQSLDLGDIASSYVGAIRFKYLEGLGSSNDELSIAYPSPNVKTLPIKNEVVRIRKSPSGVYVYERTGIEITPNINSSENSISSTFPPKGKVSNTNTNNYSKVRQTGIARGNDDSTSDTDGYGEYFEPNVGIHKLRLYEGDTLIESRFGQSIRLSGYNNPDNSFSPTTIIRNVENPNTVDEDNVSRTTVEEDVNRDGSIIVMSSNQYRLPFQPGTVDENGSSDFETSPESFQNYPSDLTGNQLLLNTGRMILSAKTGEMIFYSKKNYGFISDGAMSIDNRLGINITVGDNINITAEDRNINFNTNEGSINLGNQDLQPLVRGDELVSVMNDLIDAITQQVYATPSGPSSTGPLNIAQFNKIKQQLRNILSSYNSTS